MSIPILTTDGEVADLAAELARHKIIAVDLEADSMHSYRQKVCLLQFSTPEETVLLDPLAGADLRPLSPVMADAGIRKIFHAADYDLRCLRRDFDLQVRGLFDTMVAAQFLGEERVGLADVLARYFGVELDKKFQRADWSQRPLPEGMVRYAAEDTRHLHRLAAIFEEKLAGKGRLGWVAEEFALLEEVGFQEQEGPLFLRFKGAGRLDRRQLALLEELLQWRDREAERRDRPAFKVIGNKPLLEVATHTPRTLRGLVGLEGLFPRLVDRYGPALLKAVERGMALPEGELPIYPRSERRQKDPAADKRLARLKQWRQTKAAELQIDPGILINNALLETLSRQPPATAGGLAAIPEMKNWQREVLGEGIVQTLAG